MELTVLIVGLGSIGRRHIRLLRTISHVRVLHVSCKKSTIVNEKEIGVIERFPSISHAVAEKPDFAIVATPSAYHLKPAFELVKAGIPLLIEKPISHNIDGLDKFRKEVEDKKLPVTVGFQMRHHPTFITMKRWIDEGKIGRPLCLIGEVGQYLPDWRNGIDYRDNYSASKSDGGGVILDLCHEIDIALQLMGPAKKVSCVCNTFSDLSIDSEDIALITLEHKKSSASQICLNYVNRKYTWQTKVIGEQGTVIWDYGMGYAKLFQQDGITIVCEDPTGFTRDELFRLQLNSWLKAFKGEIQPMVTLNEGIQVAKICCDAEKSAMEEKQISL